MVEISLSGSGEGPGWVTAPGYSTAPFSDHVRVSVPRRTRIAEPSAPNRAALHELSGPIRAWGTLHRSASEGAR
jgi:hypothetical protein